MLNISEQPGSKNPSSINILDQENDHENMINTYEDHMSSYSSIVR